MMEGRRQTMEKMQKRRENAATVLPLWALITPKNREKCNPMNNKWLQLQLTVPIIKLCQSNGANDFKRALK